MAVENIHWYSAKTISGLVVLFGLLAWETAAPFLHLFAKGRERFRHGLRNLAIGATNAALVSFFAASAWASAALWSSQQGFGLLNWLNLPPSIHFLGAVVLLDLWMYWWHWANHQTPLFWRFHRAHHSDTHMDVTTASRFHLGEILFSALARILVVALTGVRLWEIIAYESLMFVIVQFHHANIALPHSVDRFFRCFCVSPNMHKVHHSLEPAETDSNYGSIFSCWDRLFQTFRLRARPEEIQFGLSEFRSRQDQGLIGFVGTPFRSARKMTNAPPSMPKPG
jgi:sterol desaturase/sphingolipid hydroxylase (fatty acid hydroxylase superfamily)